jgi:hypothetical protein
MTSLKELTEAAKKRTNHKKAEREQVKKPTEPEHIRK